MGQETHAIAGQETGATKDRRPVLLGDFGEGCAETAPSGFEVFGEDAGFAYGGHEVGVAHPARHGVEMEMAGYACAGGFADVSYQARAQAVAHALIDQCCGREIVVQVLHSETLAAYRWPDGHIDATRGLADRLSDQELTAAGARELGYLIDDGEVDAV